MHTILPPMALLYGREKKMPEPKKNVCAHTCIISIKIEEMWKIEKHAKEVFNWRRRNSLLSRGGGDQCLKIDEPFFSLLHRCMCLAACVSFDLHFAVCTVCKMNGRKKKKRGRSFILLGQKKYIKTYTCGPIKLYQLTMNKNRLWVLKRENNGNNLFKSMHSPLLAVTVDLFSIEMAAKERKKYVVQKMPFFFDWCAIALRPLNNNKKYNNEMIMFVLSHFIMRMMDFSYWVYAMATTQHW